MLDIYLADGLIKSDLQVRSTLRGIVGFGSLPWNTLDMRTGEVCDQSSCPPAEGRPLHLLSCCFELLVNKLWHCLLCHVCHVLLEVSWYFWYFGPRQRVCFIMSSFQQGRISLTVEFLVWSGLSLKGNPLFPLYHPFISFIPSWIFLSWACNKPLISW